MLYRRNTEMCHFSYYFDQQNKYLLHKTKILKQKTTQLNQNFICKTRNLLGLIN